jgi:adenine-specific DNA-methyltransferase
MTTQERGNVPEGWKPFQLVSLQTYGLGATGKEAFCINGQEFRPGPNKAWRTTVKGLTRLFEANRIHVAKNTIRYKQYLSDFPFVEVRSIWEDTGRDPENLYVVQTPTGVIERCILMTTEPGDLVLDPTCGSGSTAYVAEQWGRRWITIDTSRVPLALARQRLLTATFPWYELKDEGRGPVSGFVYVGKETKKGEEVGGIVPHVTLESIANNEPPKEEVLVDRPEKNDHITRVTGPFCVEATIPTPVDVLGEDEKGVEATTPTGAGAHSRLQMADSRGAKAQIADAREEQTTYVDRMLEVLRKSPVLRLGGNRTVTLKNIRPPAKTLSLSAEALLSGPCHPERSEGSASPVCARPKTDSSSASPPQNDVVERRCLLGPR